MAHVSFVGDIRVGRYTVSTPAFERVALPALTDARGKRGVVVVDEIGRMELASAAFVTSLGELLDGDLPVLATVHVHSHPVTDALKARPDVELVQVTTKNRKGLTTSLSARLTAVWRHLHLPPS